MKKLIICLAVTVLCYAHGEGPSTSFRLRSQASPDTAGSTEGRSERAVNSELHERPQVESSHQRSDLQKEAITARAKKRTAKEHRIAIPRPSLYASGRDYYDALINDASKRHWAFPISFNYAFENGGFDCNGSSAGLASVIFGKCPITIQDVYLFSKLSIDNKVRIKNCEALMPDRGGIPIGIAGQPFGMFSDDLYTTLLAPVQLVFDAEMREFTFVPSAIFHYDFGKHEQYAMAGGINIPIKSRTHELSISCQGGELFRGAFVPDTIQAENSLAQFHREFIDVQDFIAREIFGKKGIIFEPCQNKFGFGDISLFVAFEYHGQPSIEAGLACVLPTAGSGKSDVLWEPILGNGGAYQFNPFIQALFSTSSCYLNPFIRIATEWSASFNSTNIRVPRLVTNPVRQQVKDVPGLDHPDTFENFYVDPFSEYDSCVPLISKKICGNLKIGNKLILGLGNYAFNVFHEDFRWGIYYDYMHKSKDSIKPGKCDCCCGPDASVDLCLTCTQLDIATAEKCTDQNAHIISSSLTYKFSNMFELGFGGQFVIRGKNVPRTKLLYLNVMIVF